MLPTLSTLSSDSDIDVRRHGAQLLVEFLSSVDAKWGTELLAVGSSILQEGLRLATRMRQDDRVCVSNVTDVRLKLCLPAFYFMVTLIAHFVVVNCLSILFQPDTLMSCSLIMTVYMYYSLFPARRGASAT